MEELIERARFHDCQAWNELYALTSKEAYYIALKIVGEQNAQDLLQDAFITAYEKIEFLVDFSSFQVWLNTIVANKCRDFLRKSKPILFAEMENDEHECVEFQEENLDYLPENKYDEAETAALITEILSELPEDQKMCVILYYYQEMSIVQISAIMHASAGTIKSRLNYARKKIKEKVLALEKSGTKLYGLTSIPFFVVLLKSESSAASSVKPMKFPQHIPQKTTLDNGIKKGLAKITSAFSNSGVRIGAAIVTAAIVTTGGWTLIKKYEKENVAQPESLSEVQEITANTQEKISNAAIYAFEEYLTTGLTEQCMPINFYSIIDIENDGVPELLVADSMTSKEWLTSRAEIYSFENGEVKYINSLVSHYDYFYTVNNNAVLGANHYGPIFVTKNDKKYVELYHWNEAGTKNDPAIVYEDGSFDYITAEEFEYYRYIPGDEDYSKQNNYVKSAEVIQLQPNTFADEIPIVIKTEYFNLLLPKSWDGKYVFDEERYNMREKENYEIGHGGWLFSIKMYDTREEFEPIASYRELGEFTLSNGTTKYFVALYPTDVQCTVEKQHEYNALKKDVETILNRIVWKVERAQ